MSDLQLALKRRPIPIATPAVATGFTITPTTTGAWRILGLLLSLATSAVVANRHVNLTLGDGNLITWRATAAQDQAASLTTVYQAYPLATPTNVVAGLTNIQLPPDGLWLPRGWTLTVSATGLDVADQFSAITADIQVLPDGPDYFTEPSMNLSLVELDQ